MTSSRTHFFPTGPLLAIAELATAMAACPAGRQQEVVPTLMAPFLDTGRRLGGRRLTCDFAPDQQK